MCFEPLGFGSVVFINFSFPEGVLRGMEEEMEDMVEYTFTVIEIDLDYEFDAPRYFDFSCEESPADSRCAESWFESAGTYPPSRKRFLFI